MADQQIRKQFQVLQSSYILTFQPLKNCVNDTFLNCCFMFLFIKLEDYSMLTINF